MPIAGMPLGEPVNHAGHAQLRSRLANEPDVIGQGKS